MLAQWHTSVDISVMFNQAKSTHKSPECCPKTYLQSLNSHNEILCTATPPPPKKQKTQTTHVVNILLCQVWLWSTQTQWHQTKLWLSTIWVCFSALAQQVHERIGLASSFFSVVSLKSHTLLLKDRMWDISRVSWESISLRAGEVQPGDTSRQYRCLFPDWKTSVVKYLKYEK